MTLSSMSIALLILMVCNYISYAWAVKRFFSTDIRSMPKLMSLTAAAGSFTMLIQLASVAIAPRNTPLWIAAGSGLLLMSLVIFWWALAVNWRTKLPIAFYKATASHLQTSGPYYVLRHPIYFSYMLCWIGGAVATTQSIAWVGPVLMYSFYRLAARDEERRFLMGEFAIEYQYYQKRTVSFFV